MKRNAKIRLTLNRETLRNLNTDEMRAVEGGEAGTATPNCNVSVVPTVINCSAGCFTQTCPTRCGQTYCYYV
jgi:hypothetical protein